MNDTLHGSCVRFEGAGLLLLGPSGAGKSDLSLRLIDAGGTLVADDRIALSRASGRLVAAAPAALAGLIEIRGVGLVRMPHLPSTPLDLVLALTPEEAIERMPEPAQWRRDGVSLPLFRVNPFAISSIAKIRLLAAGSRPGLQAVAS